MRDVPVSDVLAHPQTTRASFDVVAGRQSVRVHVFATLRRLRLHSHAVERQRDAARSYEPRLCGSTWGIKHTVNGRRTGLCAVVTLAANDPHLMETIAHESVHAALRVLARRGVPHVSTAWQGGQRREESLATLAGAVAAAINRECHARGLYPPA